MKSSRPEYLWLKCRAMAALVFGRQTLALSCFGAMLELFPGDAYALASRAHVLAHQGRQEEALADARALVAAHPQRSAGDWFNLAYLLEATDRFGESEAAFRRALELDPKLDRQQPEEARKIIRHLKKFEPKVAAQLERETGLVA